MMWRKLYTSIKWKNKHLILYVEDSNFVFLFFSQILF